MWACWRGFRHAFAAAIAGSLLAFAALVPASPASSPDVVHFAADVRTLWLHGVYPGNASGAPAKIDDPVNNKVLTYRNARSGYGPVAYLLGGAPLPFVGDGLKANVAGQKALVGLLLVATAAFTGLLALRLGGNAALAAAALGLNPLMLTQYAADGHNDVMLAFFGVPAFLFLADRSWRRRSPGVALGAASILTKFATGPAGALVLAMWFPRWRTAFALVFAAVLFLAVVLTLTSHQQTGAQGPFFAVWDTGWDAIFRLIFGNDRNTDWVVGIAFTTFLILGAMIVLDHPLETAQDLVAASGLMLWLFLFAGFAGYLPWYQVWYLPLALASGRRWLMAAGMLFSTLGYFLVLVRMYDPVIARHVGIDQPRQVVVLAAWAITGLVTLWFWRHDRRHPAREPLPAVASA
jgi:hypothetical protein